MADDFDPNEEAYLQFKKQKAARASSESADEGENAYNQFKASKKSQNNTAPSDDNSIESLVDSAEANGVKNIPVTDSSQADDNTPISTYTGDTPFVPANISPDTQDKMGAGLVRGARDVGQSIGNMEQPLISWAGQKAEIISPEDLNVAKQLQSAREQEFTQQYGNNKLAQGGRMMGQMGASLPLISGGGELLGGTLGAIGKAAPILQKAANVITGNPLTNIPVNAARGYMQGASANALAGQDANEGGELGAAIGVAAPAVFGTGKYLYNTGKAAIAPFTEGGQNALADKIIQKYAEGSPVDANLSEIVAGSKPTLAEATGNPGIASLQRTMREQPGNNPFVAREQQNADARNELLLNAMGTPQDIEAARAARSDYAKSVLGSSETGDEGKLFSNAGNVDSSPVIGKISEILNSPSGKRPAVMDSMDKVKSMLVDGDGNVEGDPATLYHSVRKGIDDLLDKTDLTSKKGQQSASQLMAVKDSLDDVIESGAPGFKQYLNDYSSVSSPINSMKWMQGLNLTNAQGNITLGNVQRALKNVNKLQGASGINDAKSLNSDQIDTLKSIRDDLLRNDNVNLSKAAGSNTQQQSASQNFLSTLLPGKMGAVVAKGVSPETVGAAIGGLGGHALGFPELGGAAGLGAGATLGAMAGRSFSGLMAEKNQAVQNAIKNKLLNPELFNSGSQQNIMQELANSPYGRAIMSNYIPAGVISKNRLNGQ